MLLGARQAAWHRCGGRDHLLVLSRIARDFMIPCTTKPGSCHKRRSVRRIPIFVCNGAEGCVCVCVCVWWWGLGVGGKSTLCAAAKPGRLMGHPFVSFYYSGMVALGDTE